MRAFQRSWAVPQRSGDVAGGSRARINDFALVLGGFGGRAKGAHARVGHPSAGNLGTPKPKNLNKHQQREANGLGQACLGKVQGQGQACKMTHLRRRAKRGGEYFNYGKPL